ncbi:MAG: hypothetical protein SGBAC_009918 [Bacillariaceae sp.]
MPDPIFTDDTSSDEYESDIGSSSLGDPEELDEQQNLLGTSDEEDSSEDEDQWETDDGSTSEEESEAAAKKTGKAAAATKVETVQSNSTEDEEDDSSEEEESSDDEYSDDESNEEGKRGAQTSDEESGSAEVFHNEPAMDTIDRVQGQEQLSAYETDGMESESLDSDSKQQAPNGYKDEDSASYVDSDEIEREEEQESKCGAKAIALCCCFLILIGGGIAALLLLPDFLKKEPAATTSLQSPTSPEPSALPSDSPSAAPLQFDNEFAASGDTLIRNGPQADLKYENLQILPVSFDKTSGEESRALLQFNLTGIDMTQGDFILNLVSAQDANSKNEDVIQLRRIFGLTSPVESLSWNQFEAQNTQLGGNSRLEHNGGCPDE